MEDRLLPLLEAHLEGRLTDAQAGELGDALRASPEARRAFWEYVEQHALIEDILAESRGRDLALAEGGGLATRDPHPRPSRGLAFAKWAWGLTAASLLLAAGSLHWMSSRFHAPPAEPAHAQVVELVGGAEVSHPAGPATPVRLGQRIDCPATIRTEGGESSAVIEYPDRTRLRLGTETTVTLAGTVAGNKRVSFDGGVLLADVPPQPDGFPMIVAGPRGEVRVSDTRFLFASAGPDSSRLDVEKGRGRVSAGGGRPVVLDAGSVALVGPGSGEVVVRPMPVTVTEPRAEANLEGLRSVAFSPDGKTILSSTSYQAVLWDGAGRLETVPLFPKRWDGWQSSWSPDGTVLAVGNHKTRRMLLWGLATRGVRRTLDMPDGLPPAFVVAPRGAWVAGLDPKERATRLRVWDGETGVERAVPRMEPTIGAFAAAPDGRRLAVGRGDKRASDKNALLILDALTGNIEASLPVRVKAVGGMAFSADGRLLAFGTGGRLQIWDVAARRCVREIRGHERHVRAIAFSPDGKLLAGATHEGPVWVWSAADGAEAALLGGPPAGVQALAFAPDGRTLATVQANGAALRLWDIPPAR